MLSPIILNIYSEGIFHDALTKIEVEIRIYRQYINLRYADVTVLLATHSGDLQFLLDRVGALLAGNEEIDL